MNCNVISLFNTKFNVLVYCAKNSIDLPINSEYHLDGILIVLCRLGTEFKYSQPFLN
jgi:hypothetical protein